MMVICFILFYLSELAMLESYRFLGLFEIYLIYIFSDASDDIPYIFYLDEKISFLSGILSKKLVEKKLTLVYLDIVDFNILFYFTFLGYHSGLHFVDVFLELPACLLELFGHIMAQVFMIVVDIVKDMLMLQQSFVDRSNALKNKIFDVIFSLFFTSTER
jgi:hypothetical protein